MKEFLNFITINYQWLLTLLCGLCTMIICLLKKKYKVIVPDYISKVLLQLPEYINIAENSGKSGSEKFAYVLGRCLAAATQYSSLSVDEITAKYGDMFNNAIENTLSTPQKK